jgi:DNA-binding Lrp family transcriptional regulator
MHLKPQDTLLLLKYCSLRREGGNSSVRNLAEAIGISASEVSKGSKRLVASHLAVERSGVVYAERGALLEWLCYGVRYAYPLESTGYGRGMATSWNCAVLKSEMAAPSPPIVWAVPGGDVEGALIKPIHNSVPFAASRDEWLYSAMSLVEAIRGGKPRELAIARGLLKDLIKGT